MATALPSTARLSRGCCGLHNASLGKLPIAPGVTGRQKKIIKDNNHPSHCLFTPLPSRRRGQYRCIKAGTEKLFFSLYFKAIRLVNSNHKLRKAAANMETQTLASLTNRSLVTCTVGTRSTSISLHSH